MNVYMPVRVCYNSSMQKPPAKSIDLVNSWSFFSTPEAERLEIAKTVDALTGGEPEALQHLSKLVEWAKAEGACEEAYNNTDFSGE